MNFKFLKGKSKIYMARPLADEFIAIGPSGTPVRWVRFRSQHPAVNIDLYQTEFTSYEDYMEKTRLVAGEFRLRKVTFYHGYIPEVNRYSSAEIIVYHGTEESEREIMRMETHNLRRVGHFTYCHTQDNPDEFIIR